MNKLILMFMSMSIYGDRITYTPVHTEHLAERPMFIHLAWQAVDLFRMAYTALMQEMRTYAEDNGLYIGWVCSIS